jgi:hypothetical protein
LCTAVGALTSVALHNELFALVTALAVVGIYIMTRLFGFAELMLVKDHLITGVVSMFQLPWHGQGHRTEIRLQGTAAWGKLWRKLTECAGELNLKMIRLDVNVPAIYEGYHATVQYPHGSDSEGMDLWRAEIPLTVKGQPAGRLEVIGRRGHQPVWSQIATLMKLAEGLEVAVATLSGSTDPAAGAENGSVTNGPEAREAPNAGLVPGTRLATNGQASL